MTDSWDLEAIRAEVEELYKKRHFAELDQFLAGLPPAILEKEPEIVIRQAATWSAQFRSADVKHLLEKNYLLVRDTRNDSLIWRWDILYASQLILEGNLTAARNILVQCLSHAEVSGAQRIVAQANHTLGNLASHLGEVDAAMQHYKRALVAWRRMGAKFEIGAAHHNLGTVLREWGRYQEAVSHVLLAEEYFSQLASADELVYSAAERALLLLFLDGAELAERVARAALAKCADISASSYIVAGVNRILGAILLVSGQRIEARQRLMESMRLVKATNAKSMEAEIHEELAMLEISEGQLSAADEHRKAVRAYFDSIGASKHSLRFNVRFAAAEALRKRL